jgi:hypothetical protein
MSDEAHMAGLRVLSFFGLFSALDDAFVASTVLLTVAGRLSLAEWRGECASHACMMPSAQNDVSPSSMRLRSTPRCLSVSVSPGSLRDDARRGSSNRESLCVCVSVYGTCVKRTDGGADGLDATCFLRWIDGDSGTNATGDVTVNGGCDGSEMDGVGDVVVWDSGCLPRALNDTYANRNTYSEPSLLFWPFFWPNRPSGRVNRVGPPRNLPTWEDLFHARRPQVSAEPRFMSVN